MTQTVDEAVSEALGGIRSTLKELRDDFKEHLEDDRAVWKQVEQWSGALGIAKWVLGLGVPAILAALVAHVVRHW